MFNKIKNITSLGDLAINGGVPAFDVLLHVGHPNIGDRDVFLKYVNELFNRHWLTNNGPLVKEFEQKVARYHNVKHCVAVCNGTMALEIAIKALGLEGEVIVPSFTFIATAHALSWQKITPVFADINTETHNIDSNSVRKMITSKTTGIIGVHLWGRSSASDELKKIADEYNLKLMFDAAHAFGCSHEGKMIGSSGICEVLSFHATKFFNSFEGGTILTNDDEFAEKTRLMRNFGFTGTDEVSSIGINGKMIEIVAAMGLANFDSLDYVIDVNRQNYMAYKDGLQGLPGIKVLSFEESERNNYQYVVMEVETTSRISRDEIINTLQAENIMARKYFWPACHNMEPYRKLYPKAGQNLPNTKLISERVVVLPTGTMINIEMVKVIVSIISVLVTG